MVFVSCGVPAADDSEPLPPLDDAAVRACAIFTPVAVPVRDGALTGPRLFRSLQNAFNEARVSQTPGFSDQVRLLYGAAVADDRSAVQAQASALQSRCARPEGG